MTEPPEGGCCKCVFSFTLTSAFAAFFLWLSLRPSNPICSIEYFYVFALNKTLNSPNTNHTIHYDLKLNNKNNDKGIYYNALNLTFYYKPNYNLSFPIGSGNYSGFYQGHQKSTNRVGNVVKSGDVGVKWEKDAIEAVSKNGMVVFRVELVTAVRFKIVFWKTKRHRLSLGADLQVNDQGNLVRRKKNKGIKLTSGAGEIKCLFKLLSTLISVMIVLHLW